MLKKNSYLLIVHYLNNTVILYVTEIDFSNIVFITGISCWNPAFDVTPASLIEGIITEMGVFKPPELKEKFSSNK